ncbi:hypothetical protein VHEMI09956 [[Torrubiella] hemipterigena]|uniref:MmgE/PrpD family protein n=1 Tax=[Torrubiella] hemipterigena TaxID=1531966 RepID=A0A0A1TSF9_9HYPO|nr:hypothetical protein VHEMI09956 [[Torrubiella] hemipterigena]
MAESSPTETLAKWVSALTYDEIPESIITRTKYLILDGLACAFVGSHLPWSEKAATALLSLEHPFAGDATIFGWEGRKATALTAALVNSTFIQGFELDDWHSRAPLHSNSILLPALFAAAQHVTGKESDTRIDGRNLILATVAGYEVGPRVGLALYGSHVLSKGWHSGAVFGPAASAASVSKLLGLDAGKVEDAFGIACTQACGLMSAQFESEVKRMQHGFAARNGLMAAMLARDGYIGIKKVFERDYGGFLTQFSAGNGKTPAYLPDELVKGLGQTWQTENICIKAYAAMAGTHPTIDCVRQLQEEHPEKMKDIKAIKKVTITLGDAAFHHGGWKTTRPLTSTGAQMSNSFVAATQIVHGSVMPVQFTPEQLENEDTWRLTDLTECVLATDSEWPFSRQNVRIEFEDSTEISYAKDGARGIIPPLTNDEIVDKWRQLTKNVIDQETTDSIEKFILSLDTQEDVSGLYELMGRLAKNPIA